MKIFISFLFLLIALQGSAQRSLPYPKEFTHPDLLAHALTDGLGSEREKARAIFYWIAENIQYNTAIFNRYSKTNNLADPADTMTVWKSADEMTALRVLQRGTAVCAGYACLFKTLCEYAGLHAVVITGYGQCFGERGYPFRTNHSWNAVRIDSIWQLVDVTWGSGTINYAGAFMQRTDETYFLTPPAQFIRDHLPEDISWTLLSDPPASIEFSREPFRYRSFVKYGITGFLPARGVIEASPGDTIRIEVRLKDPEKNKMIAPGSVFDSLLANALPGTAFLQAIQQENRLVYTYIVGTDAAEWINIMYNNDPVLRYCLKLKKSKGNN